jgi:two-component system CheB/CheR fusion protein
MAPDNLNEKIHAARQRLDEFKQRLEKPRRTDKAALKETLDGLTAALGELEASAAPAPGGGPAAPTPAPAGIDEQRKDEFLSILGHELRNSLAPILNSLHVLNLRGAPDEGQRRFLDVIDRQTHHMAHLVNNLLDVSRIARGRVELHKEPVGLEALVNRAVESSRPYLESRGQKLTVTLPPRSVVIDADPARMEQVLTNLLSNAAKFTDVGGQIWLAAEYQGGAITLRVRDTGVGIAPEMRQHIFDPFAPMEHPMSHPRGGLGLGLTLVHGLVEMHGGTIEAFSEGPGKGSEFVIRMPATLEAPPAEAPAPAEAAAEQEQPLRVLVIEDNKDTASTLGVILKLWGHEIEIAYNGHAGLNAARQFRPDVVLLDIELPGLDGYTVAKSMRQVPELEQTTLVAISGYGQPEDQARSSEAGINYHYTKPIDLPSLRKLLASSEKKPAAA